jgi:hypothetical protein
MTTRLDRRGRAVPRAWEPIQLRYVGSVAELMRMTTVGSFRDTTMGCGSTRRRTTAGTPCGD